MQPTSSDNEPLRQFEKNRDTQKLKAQACKPTMLGALKRRIINMITNIKNKLGVYIDLIKLYTPIGSWANKIRAPKSLLQWNPFKHISPGFLSGSLSLPDPNNLSYKPINPTRIMKWATESLLQAVTLVPAGEGNHDLADQIHNLKKATRYEIFDDMLVHSLTLSSTLSKIMKTMDFYSSNTPSITHMEHLQYILQSISKINICDREIRGLTQKTKIRGMYLPSTYTGFLKTGMNLCIPMALASARKNMNAKEIDAQKHSALVHRSDLECELFAHCHLKDYPPLDDATWARHNRMEDKIDDIIERLPKAIPFVPIGEKERLAFQLALDITNGPRIPLDNDSAFTRLAILLDPDIKHARDDITEKIILKILNQENTTLSSKFMDMIDKHMQASLLQIGVNIALKMPVDDHSPLSSELDRAKEWSQLAKLDRKALIKQASSKNPYNLL